MSSNTKGGRDGSNRASTYRQLADNARAGRLQPQRDGSMIGQLGCDVGAAAQLHAPHDDAHVASHDREILRTAFVAVSRVTDADWSSDVLHLTCERMNRSAAKHKNLQAAWPLRGAGIR